MFFAYLIRQVFQESYCRILKIPLHTLKILSDWLAIFLKPGIYNYSFMAFLMISNNFYTACFQRALLFRQFNLFACTSNLNIRSINNLLFVLFFSRLYLFQIRDTYERRRDQIFTQRILVFIFNQSTIRMRYTINSFVINIMVIIINNR